jgi:hypothetical protein
VIDGIALLKYMEQIDGPFMTPEDQLKAVCIYVKALVTDQYEMEWQHLRDMDLDELELRAMAGDR